MRPTFKSAFSLVELIVVIVIIAILVALLLPAITRARESARTVQCASNLHVLGISLFNYAARSQGELPAWSGWHVYPDASSSEDEPGLGWTEQLIPSMGATPDSVIYNCPAFPPGVPLNYFMAARWSASLGRQNLKISDVRLSSLFILSGDCTSREEYPPPFGISNHTTTDCDKDDAVFEQLVFGDESGGVNIHRGGNNVLFGDGHVALFHSFDSTSMTYDGTQMKDWADVRP